MIDLETNVGKAAGEVAVEPRRLTFYVKSLLSVLRLEDMEFDLVKDLGASEEPAGERLTLYIPNKDQAGATLKDYDTWTHEAQELLTEIGQGATAFPPVDGTWRKPDGSDLWEQTRMIYAFIDPDRFRANMSRIRIFLHRFGRETNQGKVVFEFSNLFWSIEKFDSPLDD